MTWLDNVKAIGSGLAGLGSFIGGVSGTVQPFLSFEQNQALQHDAQQWQENMSNTAHQREVADLEAAGINPILTATGGSGASTGSVGANQAQGFGDTSGFGQLQQILNNSAQMDNLRANTANLAQDTVLKGSQVLTERQKVSNMIQEMYESKSREKFNYSKIREIDANINVLKKQLSSLDSTISLNYMYQNQAKVNMNYLKELAKYTRERSRGYTESYSDSYGGHVGGPLGAGSNGQHSYSRTY